MNMNINILDQLGGGVSVLAFNSDDPSLNPAEAFSFVLYFF